MGEIVSNLAKWRQSKVKNLWGEMNNLYLYLTAVFPF